MLTCIQWLICVLMCVVLFVCYVSISSTLMEIKGTFASEGEKLVYEAISYCSLLN